MTHGSTASFLRRHDLDALRAFAMLLGIGLHAALSFAGIPWIVQDSQPSRWFGLFILAVHGFRMPLFFLVSGFFTAMLWQRRGLKSLVEHRFRRIFLPLLLGCVTIIPATNWISKWAIQFSSGRSTVTSSATHVGSDLMDAEKPSDLRDGTRVVERADTNAADSLLGIRRSADEDLRHVRRTSLSVVSFDGLGSPSYGKKLSAARLTPRGDRAAGKGNREHWRQLLQSGSASADASRTGESRQRGQREAMSWRAAYHTWLASDKFTLPWFRNVLGDPIQLFITPMVHHLWFLWFLCWLVPMFVVSAWFIETLNCPRIPSWLVVSPARLLWLVPLTFIPQWFMGIILPWFGADTSAGILPQPHVLIYYAIFFGFGALYFACGDPTGRLGRWWWLTIPVAMFVVLPSSLLTIGQRPATDIAQVTYSWFMVFGLMGLFRHLLQRENQTIRYLSDSSYWLYLAHLPLIIAAQALVWDWPLPGSIKCLLIVTTVTGFLLLVYQAMVRHTWLGRLLNGPRTRRLSAASLPAETMEA